MTLTNRLRREARERLGRVKRKIVDTPPRRLDQRPDLARYDIGRYSWGHLKIANRSPGSALTIGHFCSLAAGTEVLLGGEHRTDFVTTYRFGEYPPFDGWYQPDGPTARGLGDIVIGNDVWIGHDALILSGVTVGDGAVVGAGSVVRSNVPPYAVVLGNPARVAGFRFTPEQIAALLRIQWWDWSDERIADSLDLMMSEDIQRFIDAHDVDD